MKRDTANETKRNQNQSVYMAKLKNKTRQKCAHLYIFCVRPYICDAECLKINLTTFMYSYFGLNSHYSALFISIFFNFCIHNTFFISLDFFYCPLIHFTDDCVNNWTSCWQYHRIHMRACVCVWNIKFIIYMNKIQTNKNNNNHTQRRL